ncbi:MAG: ATP-binding cassette domain-containing protein [Phycisphaerales bacterium]
MVRLNDIRFRYPAERFELTVDDLAIDEGSATAIIGPSGCGKTTLLRVLCGILRPSQGRVEVLGENVAAMSEAAARAFRIARLGLVFQEFELLDYLDVRDNILLPFHMSSALRLDAGARTLATELAERTGIEHLLDARPRQLSQGERQRVAICRSLVTKPQLVLADEPTGNLDPANQQNVVALLRERVAEAGAGLIMVTHEHELLEHFETVVDLADVRAGAASNVQPRTQPSTQPSDQPSAQPGGDS